MSISGPVKIDTLDWSGSDYGSTTGRRITLKGTKEFYSVFMKHDYIEFQSPKTNFDGFPQLNKATFHGIGLILIKQNASGQDVRVTSDLCIQFDIFTVEALANQSYLIRCHIVNIDGQTNSNDISQYQN